MALPPLQSFQRRDEPSGQQEKYRYDSQIDEIHVHTPSLDGNGKVVLVFRYVSAFILDRRM